MIKKVAINRSKQLTLPVAKSAISHSTHSHYLDEMREVVARPPHNRWMIDACPLIAEEMRGKEIEVYSVRSAV